MLAVQPASHWHDKPFQGMEYHPPPAKRRRVTYDGHSSSAASIPTTLPYGWVPEHVLAHESTSESSTPMYPTVLSQSYWSRPQDDTSSYRSEYAAPHSAHASRFGQSGSGYASDEYTSYSPHGLDWHGVGSASHALSARSEPTEPQSAVTDPGPHRFFPNVPPSATSSSWDVMRSTPNGPQYEYLDAFQRACQNSEGNFAPYVDAPVLRSNLPMGSRTSMGPPAQPRPDPAKARQLLSNFETHLEDSLENLEADNLSVAADELLEASTSLLENANDLRLYQDKLDGNEPQPNWRQRRREIWHDFNFAWLGLLTKQGDFCLQEKSQGYPIQAPQSRISRDSLGRIGLQLRTLADMVHDLGLVDYDQGFAENRISELFEQCMGLVNELEGSVAAWPENNSNATSTGNQYQFHPFQQQ